MITVDATKLKEVEEQLGSFRNKAPVAISRALNRAAQNARTNAVKKVREDYRIKAGDVRSTIKITQASKNTLGAVVKSTGQRIPLIKFKVNPSSPRPKNPPKAIKVAVKKSGLKAVMSAFVADINGPKVFRRTGKSRLPIDQLFGPAVPQMMNNLDVREYVESEAAKMFDQRLDHEIQRILEAGK